MGDYPKATRAAAVKCIGCNAPAVRTVEGEYICVECGGQPLTQGAATVTGDGD